MSDQWKITAMNMYGGALPPELYDKLLKINQLCEEQHGNLKSRQVIAQVIVDYNKEQWDNIPDFPDVIGVLHQSEGKELKDEDIIAERAAKNIIDFFDAWPFSNRMNRIDYVKRIIKEVL
jgi:hypothetical protein